MTSIAIHGLAVIWLMLATYLLSVESAAGSISVSAASFLLASTIVGLISTIRAVAIKAFSLYGLTLFAMIAFTGAQAFVFLFASPEDPRLADLVLTSRFAPEVVVQTFAVVGCFLTAFHAGALTARRPVEAASRNRVALGTSSTSDLLAQVAAVLFVIALPFAIWRDAEVVSTAISGGYFNLYDPALAQTQSIYLTLSSFAVPMAIYVMVLRADLVRTTAILFLVGHSVLMVAIGYRGWGVLSLLAFAWAYRRAIGDISNGLLAGAGAFLTFLLPIIALVRNTPLSELTTVQVAAAYVGVNNPLWALLSETGLSASTIAWTIELVPAERPFGLGMSFVYSATAILPNLMFDVHPATANSLSNWLTWRIMPEQAAQGAGLGFSAFAELYYNFGAVVGAGAAYVIGHLISRISLGAERAGSSSLNVAVCGVLISFVPFFARADSSILFRPVMWFVIAPIALVYLMNTARRVATKPR